MGNEIAMWQNNWSVNWNRKLIANSEQIFNIFSKEIKSNYTIFSKEIMRM